MGEQKITTYKNLIVWQKSIELVMEIYTLTEQYPKDEKFGLVSQMRRAVISIPSNIAEGKLRGSANEEKRFFLMAFASGGELETQVEISKRLPSTNKVDFSKADTLLNEVMKMLNKLISNLSPST